MTKYRILCIAILIVAPFAFLSIVGGYHLWISGWTFIAWWPMAASLTLAYGLGWYWTRRKSSLMPKTGVDAAPSYWTDRDREAWKLIEARGATVLRITPEQMADNKRYADDAIGMSIDVARIYRPGAKEPFGHLTLPEILACGELIMHDLTKKVNSYIPGSHIFTVDQWKQARQAIDWGQRAWNLSWLARMAVNPLNAGVQFLASKASGSVLDRVQENVMVWFYTAYIHEVGRYLIELNSGRLKVGAKRYLELLAAHEAPPVDGSPEPTVPTATASLTVAVIGQVKAGKSSLINAMLGEQRAITDVVPVATGGTRYELKKPGMPGFAVIDTSGYGAGGPSESEFEDAHRAAEAADVILLVSHGRTAARRADVDMMDRLIKTIAGQPHLRMPPVVLALSHVDLLSPAAEWAPPYDWLRGTRPKELQMRECVKAAQDVFGTRISTAVPICAMIGREFNVQDGLIPQLGGVLDDARGIMLLKLLHKEGSADSGRKAIHQLLQTGREALKILWESAKKS